MNLASKLIIKITGKDPTKLTLHPEIKKPMEYAFTIGTKHYFKLLHMYEIPELRFAYAQQFFSELEMKMTKERQKEFIEAMKTQLDAGKLTEIAKLINEIEYRLEWLYEPDSLYRFGSVIYFNLDENIADYDMVYNKKKIRSFKKKGLHDYFVKEFVDNSEKLLNLSKPDFQTYLQEFEEIRERQQKLTSELKATKGSKPSSGTPTSSASQTKPKPKKS